MSDANTKNLVTEILKGWLAPYLADADIALIHSNIGVGCSTIEDLISSVDNSLIPLKTPIAKRLRERIASLNLRGLDP